MVEFNYHNTTTSTTEQPFPSTQPLYMCDPGVGSCDVLLLTFAYVGAVFISARKCRRSGVSEGTGTGTDVRLADTTAITPSTAGGQCCGEKWWW